MAESSVCEGCGTVLPLPDASGVVRCPSCGRIAWTRDPGDPYGPEGPPPTPAPAPFATWTPGPTVTTTTTVFQAPSPQMGKEVARASRIGCLVSLIVVASIGVGVFAVVLGASKGAGPFKGLKTSQLYPSSGSTIVVPGEGSSTDLIAVVTDNGDGSQRKLVRVTMDADGGSERWKSDPLPKDLYTARMVIEGDHLWVGGEDHLLLLSLATGKTTWSATLSDSVTGGACSSCFSLAGGNLVVRTNDAYVTAFAPASNEPRWTRRLQSASGSLSVLAGGIYVVDDAATTGDPTQVVKLDAATGKVLRTYAPSCPASEQVPYPVEMSGGDPLRIVPGTGDLVAWFGFGYGCVTRFEAHSGTVRWATGLPSGNFEDDAHAVLDAGNLVFQRSSGGPVRVDLATGKVTALEAIPDADASPRAIVGTTVIGETKSTRGTAKGGLAAWDLASGKRRWSTRLDGTTQPVSDDGYRSSDALFDGQDRTLLVTGGSVVRLVTFTGSDRSIRIQTVDVSTGELGAARTAKLRSRYSSSGTPSLTVESVSPDRLVLGVDSIIEVLQLSDGRDASWPVSN